MCTVLSLNPPEICFEAPEALILLVRCLLRVICIQAVEILLKRCYPIILFACDIRLLMYHLDGKIDTPGFIAVVVAVYEPYTNYGTSILGNIYLQGLSKTQSMVILTSKYFINKWISQCMGCIRLWILNVFAFFDYYLQSNVKYCILGLLSTALV